MSAVPDEGTGGKKEAGAAGGSQGVGGSTNGAEERVDIFEIGCPISEVGAEPGDLLIIKPGESTFDILKTLDRKRLEQIRRYQNHLTPVEYRGRTATKRQLDQHLKLDQQPRISPSSSAPRIHPE